MKSWLTKTLPPWQYVVGYLLFLAAFELVRSFSVAVDNLDPDQLPSEFGSGWFGHQMIVGFAAAAYGFWRAIYFSPIGHRAYRAWLATTPWTAGKPLPLGPWHLGPQDAVGIAILLGSAAYGGRWGLLWIPLFLVLIAYALVVTRFQWSLRQRLHAIAVWALFVALPLAWTTPWAFYAFLAAIWAGTTWSIVRLTHLYATQPDVVESVLPLSPPSEERERNELIRWPYDALLLHTEPRRNDPATCVALAALAGFVFYVGYTLLESMPPDMEGRSGYERAFDTVAGLFLCGLCSMRWFIYRFSVGAPISLLGRFQYGLILPRFDVILLAPIAIFAIMILGGILGERLGLSPPLVLAVVVAVSMIIALLAPPSLRDWRLTGGHALSSRFGKGSGQRI